MTHLCPTGVVTNLLLLSIANIVLCLGVLPYNQITSTGTMTHVDFAEISIKTEPLSPDSTQPVPARITPGPTPIPVPIQHQQHTATLSPIPSYPGICPSRREYSNIHSSPMMSSGGIVKVGPGFEQQNSLPCGPLTPNTPSTPSANATCTALKSSILKKRKARGETTPLLATDDGPREYKLTKREIERKEARKEQNRRAARRCRMKKKKIQLQASQEMQMAIKENVEMKHEVQTLREQVNHLQQLISEHEKNQNCKLSVSAYTSLLNCKSHSNTPKLKARPKTSTPISHTGAKSSPQITCLTSSSDPSLQEILTMLPDDLTAINSSNLSSSSSSSVSFNTTLSTTNSSSNISSMDTFQTPSINLTSWGSDSSNLQPEQEASEDIRELIKSLMESENMADLYVTPTVEDEEEYPHSKGNNFIQEDLIFSDSQSRESPKNAISLGQAPTTTIHKPPVVRNLSKVFMQNEIHPNSQGKVSHDFKRSNIPPPLNLASPESSPFPVDTATQASRFLLDPNLSSPILSCVPPNLVQQHCVPSSSPNNNSNTLSCVPSSNAQHTLLTSNNNTSFENQTIFQNSPNDDNNNNNQFPSDPTENDLSGITLADIESFQQGVSSSFSSIPAFQTLPYGASLTQCCINTTTSSNNDNIILSNLQDSPGGFTYQLSPVSTPSPSSHSALSSPGFLQPNELCHLNNNNHSNSDNFNNIEIVPVFDYNL